MCVCVLISLVRLVSFNGLCIRSSNKCIFDELYRLYISYKSGSSSNSSVAMAVTLSSSSGYFLRICVVTTHYLVVRCGVTLTHTHLDVSALLLPVTFFLIFFSVHDLFYGYILLFNFM